MKAIIPCAGKSSRFGYKNKALVKLDNFTVIERMFSLLDKYMEEVVIVVNSGCRKEFEKIFKNNKKVTLIVDDTFSGTGGAIKNVMQEKGEDYFDEAVFITWGDILFTSEKFITDFLAYYRNNPIYSMYVPVQWEKTPYLSIMLNKNGIPYKVFYSKKEGFRLDYGYHDLAAYILRRENYKYLNDIPMDKEEISFLDIIDILFQKNKKIKIIEFFNSPMISFNTEDELNILRSKLNSYLKKN